MNGALFASSPNLEIVDLAGNICIDQNFIADKIMILSDEITKHCGTINEELMDHFISEWRQVALKSDNELKSCLNRSEAQSRDASTAAIFEKLENIHKNQEHQQKSFEKIYEKLVSEVYKELMNKEVKLQTANERLKNAEIEIWQLRDQMKIAGIEVRKEASKAVDLKKKDVVGSEMKKEAVKAELEVKTEAAKPVEVKNEAPKAIEVKKTAAKEVEIKKEDALRSEVKEKVKPEQTAQQSN